MDNKLHILWTNDNVETAEHMVLLYAPVSLSMHKAWDEVTIIIWGATATLVAENKHIQNLVKDAQAKGVKFTGCLHCATELGVEETLSNLGVELKFWGKPLTELIKSKANLITI